MHFATLHRWPSLLDSAAHPPLRASTIGIKMGHTHSVLPERMAHRFWLTRSRLYFWRGAGEGRCGSGFAADAAAAAFVSGSVMHFVTAT